MKRMIMVAAFLMAAISAGVCSASEISDASLHKLLVLSGVDKQVRQFPPLLRMGMEQARQQLAKQAAAAHKKPPLTDAYINDLENAATRAFEPDGILQAVTKQIRRSISEEDARKMLVWFNSGTGKRINKAEEDASTPAAYRQMASMAKTLLADKPRVQFARELDELLHLTDTTMRLQENTSAAMYVAFSTANHPDQPVHVEAFRQKLEAALKPMRPKLVQVTILSSVYTYRNIDMASLNKYLAFLKTKRSLRFNDSLTAGMEAGVGQSLGKLATAIVGMAKKKHPQKI